MSKKIDQAYDGYAPHRANGAELGRMAENFEAMNTTPPTWRERFKALDLWFDRHPILLAMGLIIFLAIMASIAMNLPVPF